MGHKKPRDTVTRQTHKYPVAQTHMQFKANRTELTRYSSVGPRLLKYLKKRKADKFAKEVKKMPFIGPDFCWGLQNGHLRQAINKWEDNTNAFHCQNTPRQKQAKEIVSGLLKLIKIAGFSFGKGDLGVLTEVFTCHLKNV